MSQNIIPTSQNLHDHHVPVSEACSLCKFAHDSTCHALFQCKAIKHIWKGSSYYYVLKAAPKSSILDLCDWMRTQLSKEEFEKFAIMAWAIWKEKQRILHEEGKRELAENVTWCLALLSDFHAAKEIENHENGLPKRRTEKKWEPPINSNLKMNVDARINERLEEYNVGGVLRDKQGRLLMAFGKQINQPLSVVHGELLAIREGVKMLYEKNFGDVQIATDSLLAVQAVTASKEDIGYVGKCALELSKELKAPVISEITHVFRSANNVAHNIALFTSSSLSFFVWMNGEFPSWLVAVAEPGFEIYPG